MNAATPIVLNKETACAAPALCATSASEPLGDPCEGADAAFTMSGGLKTSKSGWGGPRANSGGPRANSGRPRIHPAPEPTHRIIQRQPLGLRWYVLILAGRAPRKVLHDLLLGETRPGFPSRPEFGSYLPTQAEERRRAGRVITGQDGKIVLDHKPCYGPGYIFAQFDAETDPWGMIAQIDGVHRILGTRMGIPIPLPPDWHDKERAQEQERMRLPQAMLDVLAPGAAVELTRGPLTGFRAIVEADTGLTTRITAFVFGQERPVLVRRDWLKVADAALAGDAGQ